MRRSDAVPLLLMEAKGAVRRHLNHARGGTLRLACFCKYGKHRSPAMALTLAWCLHLDGLCSDEPTHEHEVRWRRDGCMSTACVEGPAGHVSREDVEPYYRMWQQA
jgi:hypothetical protein